MKKFYTFMIALFTFLSGLIIIPGCAEYGALPGEWEDEDSQTLNATADIDEDGEKSEDDIFDADISLSEDDVSDEQ